MPTKCSLMYRVGENKWIAGQNFCYLVKLKKKINSSNVHSLCCSLYIVENKLSSKKRSQEEDAIKRRKIPFFSFPFLAAALQKTHARPRTETKTNSRLLGGKKFKEKRETGSEVCRIPCSRNRPSVYTRGASSFTALSVCNSSPPFISYGGGRPKRSADRRQIKIESVPGTSRFVGLENEVYMVHSYGWFWNWNNIRFKQDDA